MSNFDPLEVVGQHWSLYNKLISGINLQWHTGDTNNIASSENI